MLIQQHSSIGVGQRIGSYRIDALLGAGGMGVVYRAWDGALQRTVAIKAVDRAHSDSDATRWLLTEARLCAGLNHPSICCIHEVGHIDGQPFIVMEHVDGSPLASLIPAGRGLPLELALQYAVQIVDAVAHAHGHGVVHRDLKSSNVMISRDGRVKLLDFGLAVRCATEGEATRLETTCLHDTPSGAGTIPYMAPELLCGHSADARSDVWALGVLIYELLSGSRPFRGATRYEVGASILSDPAFPLPEGVPAWLQAVVSRSLVKDPAGRYQTAAALANALNGG
ncbi:MAG TPA: serine/threonine-protein kinase [Vicinamibacterales bacterium]|jgi:serine/threonine protein kinase